MVELEAKKIGDDTFYPLVERYYNRVGNLKRACLLDVLGHFNPLKSYPRRSKKQKQPTRLFCFSLYLSVYAI